MKAEQEVNGEREERMEAKGSKGKRRSGRSEKMCVYGSREESWIIFQGDSIRQLSDSLPVGTLKLKVLKFKILHVVFHDRPGRLRIRPRRTRTRPCKARNHLIQQLLQHLTLEHVLPRGTAPALRAACSADLVSRDDVRGKHVGNHVFDDNV